jgi:hypothetical protein
MNEERDIEGMPDAQHNQYARLAHWIQQIMQQPGASTSPHTITQDNAGEWLDLQFDSQYHLRYYQQLPDFALALLNNEPQATLRYGALLYHLAGCDVCRHAYIDIYSSLKEALQPSGPRPFLGQGTRTLSATPPRMLSHLCRTLISQAEAVLRQERHEDDIPSDWDIQSNAEEEARVLLRLALRMGAHITQHNVRRQALQDLVRVASIAEGQEPVPPNDPEARSYIPTLTGAAKTRGKVFRRADTMQSPQHGAQETFTIPLQSRNLNGTIVQRGNQLELHLKDLDATMRGHHVRVSVLLGSLIEPVRWHGRDPHAILSPTPVADDGSLVMPLGETDLHLSNSEDYQLLETLFMLVEVRKA